MYKGVIYSAIGNKYIQEALQSAESLKRVMPTIPITIFCDSLTNLKSKNIDQTVTIDKDYFDYPGLAKISSMINTPYEKTLFLDVDTYLCDDCSELFTLLDQFDIATAHAPVRDATKQRKDMDYQINIPESFPEMNTGVILFRNNNVVANLFKKWFDLCNKKLANKGKPLHDQTSFREAIYFSNARIATLTPEYNCRILSLGYVSSKVKILHGRHPDLLSAAKQINESYSPRIYQRISNQIKLEFNQKKQSQNILFIVKKYFQKIFNFINI